MASILPQGKTQFFDATGNPLSGGSVTFYAKGTTNYQNTYQDQGQTILNSNPVILDSSGSALIWGSGNYSTIVKDALGNQISSPDTAANLTVASVLLEVLPTTSTTITPTALKTIVIPVPSAAATITIEPGTIEGQEVIVYGSESWAITVASNVITGGPAFYYPDGSVNYSITLPLNAIDQITLIWDGLNWRCTTFGQTIVSPAVASNQAVQLAQVSCVSPVNINGVSGIAANTTYTFSGSFTAPCAGFVVVCSSWNNNTMTGMGDLTERVTVNGTILGSDGGGSGNSWARTDFAAVAAGLVTVDILVIIGSTALSAGVNVRGAAFFIPNP